MKTQGLGDRQASNCESWASVRVTAAAYGLDQNLSPEHRKANTAVVRTLLGE